MPFEALPPPAKCAPLNFICWMRFGEFYSIVFVLNLLVVMTFDYFAWSTLKNETSHTTWKSASRTAFSLFAGQVFWFFIIGMFTSTDAFSKPAPPVLFQFTHYSIYFNILMVYLANLAARSNGSSTTQTMLG